MVVRIDQPTSHQALMHIGSLPNEAIDIADAALWLAKWMEPAVKVDAYRRHLDTLVHDTKIYVGNDGDDDDLVLEAARQIIARRYGYGGDADPAHQNEAASLAHTIDHRRGSAGTLSILYVHVLSALGKAVEILDFTPRLLVGMTTQTGRAVLDPFEDGKLLSAQDLRSVLKNHHGDRSELTPNHLQPLNPRQVLLHLCQDIKNHHLRHGAPEAALHTLEGAVLMAPGVSALWRELGLVHIRLDHIGDAMDALERFLRLPGGDAHRYTASQMLQQLRRRLQDSEP